MLKKDVYKMPRVHKGWEARRLTSRQKIREHFREMIYDFT